MLAIAGGKGGSGKTTTALGVAGALAQRRRRPLVVDCDLDAPNLHLRAGVDRDPGVDAPDPEAAGRKAAALPGVDVLPAGDADGDDLAAALAALPADRPVLLDCPAGASEAAARPLRVADATVLVTTLGHESVEDAVKTAAMARAVGTAPCVAAVSREPSVTDGLRAALGVSECVAVPDVPAPLTADAATAAYARLADAAGADSFAGGEAQT
ncbi:MinD/ParA family ATP-binding protein [Halobacterium jilantaiense]|uniref:Septum site-determining protein MinD n=1 Tax=Halobacterium jilantaiense TaxID=355548 RepID=A0A1I0MKM0_9EURY|nr:AAA family ATPase [Halobacterium jilantaiense]SEV88498.1 septum site-determining protein MinD [Halobacterium jilantaiense]